MRCHLWSRIWLKWFEWPCHIWFLVSVAIGHFWCLLWKAKDLETKQREPDCCSKAARKCTWSSCKSKSDRKHTWSRGDVITPSGKGKVKETCMKQSCNVITLWLWVCRKWKIVNSRQPECKEGADEGLESAGEKVWEVTVAEVHADCHPHNYCLWWCGWLWW